MNHADWTSPGPPPAPTENGADMETMFRNITFVFGIIFPFVLFVVGTIGNVLCIIVLTKMMSRSGGQCPLFMILIALAASDSLLLLLTFAITSLAMAFPYTYFRFTLPLYVNHGWIILLIWPISMATQMTSIYLTVLVSYERWLAVCRPLHASSRYSIKRLGKIIALIVTCCILYNIPRIWEHVLTRQPLDPEFAEKLCCTPNSTGNDDCDIQVFGYNKSALGYNKIYRYMYSASLYAVVMFLVPFVAITGMNLALVCTLRRSKKKWMHMSRNQRKEVKLTYVPLAIVGLFYVFGMPAVLINIIDSLNGEVIQLDIQLESWQAALTISNACVQLNSAVNFVIYCLLGEKFRLTLRRMFGFRPPLRGGSGNGAGSLHQPSGWRTEGEGGGGLSGCGHHHGKRAESSTESNGLMRSLRRKASLSPGHPSRKNNTSLVDDGGGEAEAGTKERSEQESPQPKRIDKV